MSAEQADFQTLLAETGIEFIPPPGFTPCPVLENSVLNYQYALRSPDGNLEFRYRIDSFARLNAERNAMMEGMEVIASVDINQLHTLNYLAILHNLSGGDFDEPRVFSPRSAALLYGADWNALSFLRLAKNDFSRGYNTAYVLAIHKEGVADVYVVSLYTNPGSAAPGFGEDNPVPYLRFA